MFRRRANGAAGVAPRRAHAGVLRRERRTLLKARENTLRDLGGLLVEMYRRGGFRDDLLQERAAIVVGIDARLGEIEELLHGAHKVARCQCGAPILQPDWIELGEGRISYLWTCYACNYRFEAVAIFDEPGVIEHPPLAA